jgi:hypothetical protein
MPALLTTFAALLQKVGEMMSFTGETTGVVRLAEVVVATSWT